MKQEVGQVGQSKHSRKQTTEHRMATSTVKKEFIHKQIGGSITLSGSSVTERSLSQLGYSAVSGYSLINATISTQGSGATRVIPFFSGSDMSYVTFTNNNSDEKTINYTIDCLFQRT